ncbi:MAG: aldehyde dehydrogenase family protein, partial [Gammaproteobacteria bacterium]
MDEPRTLHARNPRTGENDYTFEAMSEAAVHDQARALRTAQSAWQAAGLEARIAALRALQKEIEQRQDSIATALSIDTGRGTLARGEVGGVLRSMERWCTIAPELMRGVIAPSSLPNVSIEQTIEPYPLLGVISPWNFPLLLSFIDATPALLAGCAVLIKPSEVTPRFAAAVAQAVEAVPKLRDVLAFCPGDGATGAALVP